MSLAATSTDTMGIPGVYAQPRPRAGAFFRLRTDVAGFVGFAGPRHVGRPRRIDDWKSFVETYLRDRAGNPIAPPTGAELTYAVRAYFANGGRQCFVVNAGEKARTGRADEAMARLLDLNGPDRFFGLEALLEVPDVFTVAIPDLFARQEREIAESFVLSNPERASFGACSAMGKQSRVVVSRRSTGMALFNENDILWAQRYMIDRLGREPWRHFLLLCPPGGKDSAGASDWRHALMHGRTDEGDHAALYWPWIETQDSPGAPTRLNCPLGHVAGLFARTDVEKGPQSSPANAPLSDSVGVDAAADPAALARLIAEGINPILTMPRGALTVWGARTLLWREDKLGRDTLVFVNARRLLSAIIRTVSAIGESMAFTANTFLEQMTLRQTIVDYLSTVFEAGAFAGETEEEAFRVTIVEDESKAEKIVVEIAVALAAPAEFVIFRVGRRDGVIEIEGRL